MKRSFLAAIALAVCAAACGSSTSPSNNTPTKPTFTADLRPANEVPPVTNAESTGSGTATITFDTTKDSAGNITSATVTFVVTLSGFPNGTPVNAAHIHQAAAGTVGGIVVQTNLNASDGIALSNGSGSFTKANQPITPELAQQIINNPAGFYFNVHSTTNPSGFARGQLVKVQ
jgi:outer membrane lipoprotein SlyB